MRVEVRFADTFPVKHQASVLRLLRRYADELAPRLNSLYVEWGGALEGHTGSIAVQSEYRTARLYLDPGSWAGWSEAEREELIVHELTHVNQEPVSDVVHRLVSEFVPEDLRKYVWKGFVEAYEGVTEDMARAYLAVARRATPRPAKVPARRRRRAR